MKENAVAFKKHHTTKYRYPTACSSWLKLFIFRLARHRPYVHASAVRIYLPVLCVFIVLVYLLVLSRSRVCMNDMRYPTACFFSCGFAPTHPTACAIRPPVYHACLARVCASAHVCACAFVYAFAYVRLCISHPRPICTCLRMCTSKTITMLELRIVCLLALATQLSNH